MSPAANLKICHFTSAHRPYDVRIFLKECTSLANAGFEVFLVAANCTEEEKNGVKIINVPVPDAGRIKRIINTAPRIYKKALSLNADIYHFHDPELLPYALKLIRKGKKVIYDAHEDLPRQISGKHWIPALFRKPVAAAVESYEDYVCKRLSCIITSTPAIRERFLKINSHTIDVCNYPLLNEISEMPVWSERKQEICYVGSISVIRGVRELVQAMNGLEGIRLNMAGAWSPETLKAELESYPGWEKVHEYGFVDRQGIVSILNRSKIGIVTLYPQSNYLESLPIKMFEYMLAGIPVIASDFPLWREIVMGNNCGICIDPQDPSQISQAVDRILADDEMARKMGENGRKAVLDKYSWKNEEKKLLEVYEQLSAR